MHLRLSRDLLYVVLLFIALFVMTGYTALRRAEEERTRQLTVPYSTHTATDDGALALQMWLDAMGYRTQRIENESFSVRDDARVLFVIAPSEKYENAEAQAVVRWVERGNTLIVVENSFLESSQLVRELKARSVYLSQYVERAALEQPLADRASVREVAVRTGFGLALDRNDFVEYVSAQGSPLLVSFAQGQGRVWLSSSPWLFTNGGLRDPSNAVLVAAMLRAAPRGSVIAFDEYHLGFNDKGEAQSLSWVLFNTPPGWAFLYAFLVGLAYLAINGQRFGRVVPLPREIARRSPSEYVVSMAQLFRRAGKREMVLNHYRQSLKRRLGRPYHLNPDLPDDQFLATMAQVRRDLDRESLAQTLRELNQRRVSERELVKLAEHAVELGDRPRI